LLAAHTISALIFDKLLKYRIPISSLAEPAAPVWVGAKKFSMKDRYETTVLSSEQISKILPHRYPFLLVDRVVEFEAGKRLLQIFCARYVIICAVEHRDETAISSVFLFSLIVSVI
jgi:hypothetical protein